MRKTKHKHNLPKTWQSENAYTTATIRSVRYDFIRAIADTSGQTPDCLSTHAHIHRNFIIIFANIWNKHKIKLSFSVSHCAAHFSLALHLLLVWQPLPAPPPFPPPGRSPARCALKSKFVHRFLLLCVYGCVCNAIVFLVVPLLSHILVVYNTSEVFVWRSRYDGLIPLL